jgi:hypothetical protein
MVIVILVLAGLYLWSKKPVAATPPFYQGQNTDTASTGNFTPSISSGNLNQDSLAGTTILASVNDDVQQSKDNVGVPLITIGDTQPTFGTLTAPTAPVSSVPPSAPLSTLKPALIAPVVAPKPPIIITTRYLYPTYTTRETFGTLDRSRIL